MRIVQIGTCEGNDDLSTLIDQNEPDLLVLVEPLHIHNEKILKCYGWINNLILENIAITDEEKDTLDFFYHENDGPAYHVASTNINHILKHGYNIDGIQKITVNCMTINQLFDKHNLININILFIDAEGIDDKIIKSIDFNRYSIDSIYFEKIKDMKLQRIQEKTDGHHWRKKEVVDFINNIYD